MDDRAPRLAIVFNEGAWFVRRVSLVHQDDTKGEMVYHCDEHWGGPFKTPEEAFAVAKSNLEEIAN